MKNNNHLVIMAGGVGSRFWPMSTPEKPKQFIDILGSGRSLIQQTVERFSGICPMENIWIVTAEKYYSIIKEQLPEIADAHILLEPCMRNTAPCIAYVAWKIKKQDPEANLVISPSDHIVTNVPEFKRVIREGLKFTEGQDRILTLGMKPVRPEIGYGYIKINETGKVEGTEIVGVEGFKEKPDKKTAEYYLKDGGYFWNAGIFLWNVRTVEKAFRENLPDMAALFDSLNEVFYSEREQTVINEEFPKCEKISIDYAIMERARNIYVYPADFGWSDLGTWGALYELSSKDSGKNAVIGAGVKTVDCKECVVRVSDDKKIIIQGLDGYIVAEHNGAVLICRKEDEQRIKEFCS